MRHVNVLEVNASVSMDISRASLDPDISKLGLTILRLWQQFNLFQHLYTLSVQDIECRMLHSDRTHSRYSVHCMRTL